MVKNEDLLVEIVHKSEDEVWAMRKKDVREKLQAIPTIHKSRYPKSLDKANLVNVYTDWQKGMKKLQNTGESAVVPPTFLIWLT